MTDDSRIRVGVNGARGQMGRITLSALATCQDMTCVFETDKGDDLRAAILDSKAGVVVDFTIPDAVFSNAMTIVESGSRPVVGTTGLKPAELDELDRALVSRGLGGIVAPNFSLGALLLMKLSTEAARYMKHCEIIEYHHEKKIDSPSGTALMTAERITDLLEENSPC
ncbi:MAG: 4-hydroxy-tetrahydrodipicolinate reductase, partial [Planctomycetota bacterium]